MSREEENNLDPAPEDVLESLDELKERLSSMKRMMAERKASGGGGGGNQDLFNGRAGSLSGTSVIDGSFLSFVFGGALCVILSVSVYAFYNLYHAVLKRFPSHHTEL